MQKLNYIESKITEVKNTLSEYEERTKINYWEETTVKDLKKELSILESIREDYKKFN